LKVLLFFFYSAVWEFFALFFPNRSYLLCEHHNDIVEVEEEERSVENYKVYSLRLPTSCGRDSRADEEQDVHIISEHYSDSAHSVDRSGDVSDVKLIRFVKFKVVDEFFKHCGLPLLFLSVYIIPHLKRFVKGFLKKNLFFFTFPLPQNKSQELRVCVQY
jgi:hypothetical protein